MLTLSLLFEIYGSLASCLIANTGRSETFCLDTFLRATFRGIDLILGKFYSIETWQSQRLNVAPRSIRMDCLHGGA